MPATVSNYVMKVHSTTLAVGITLGVLSVYLKDLYQHSYNDAWDNPFANLILFLLIGIGESLVPLLAFTLLTKLLVNLMWNINGKIGTDILEEKMFGK